MRLFHGIALTTLLIASAGACALQPAEQDPQEQAAPGKKPIPQGGVMGHVICTDTHAPARGARIMLFSFASLTEAHGPIGIVNGQPHTAVTGLDGAFFLSHVAPGEYIVMALAAGYLSPMDGMEMPRDGKQSDAKVLAETLRKNGPTVRVSGQGAARIDIELVRGAVLSGKVVYSDGSPAGQRPVQIQKSTPPKPGVKPEDSVDLGEMVRMMFLQQTHSTDDQGHFRISGIGPGSYWVSVTQSFEANAGLVEELVSSFDPSTKPTGKLTIYSGNALHRKDAKVYELRPGDTVDGIEIVLPLNGLHSIQGTAAGKDGALLNAGTLDLVDTTDPTINFRTAVEVDGEFHFTGVPEGTYQLKVRNAFILEDPAAKEEELLWGETPQRWQYMQQFNPQRAFVETTVPVTVQSSDIEGFTLTLANSKLPEAPKTPIDGTVPDPQ